MKRKVLALSFLLCPGILAKRATSTREWSLRGEGAMRVGMKLSNSTDERSPGDIKGVLHVESRIESRKGDGAGDGKQTLPKENDARSDKTEATIREEEGYTTCQAGENICCMRKKTSWVCPEWEKDPNSDSSNSTFCMEDFVLETHSVRCSCGEVQVLQKWWYCAVDACDFPIHEIDSRFQKKCPNHARSDVLDRRALKEPVMPAKMPMPTPLHVHPTISNDDVVEFVDQTHQIIQDGPEFVEHSPEIIEAVPEFVERTPQIIKDWPEIVEHSPEIIEAVPEFVEHTPEIIKPVALANHQTLDADPEWIEDAIIETGSPHKVADLSSDTMPAKQLPQRRALLTHGIDSRAIHRQDVVAVAA